MKLRITLALISFAIAGSAFAAPASSSSMSMGSDVNVQAEGIKGISFGFPTSAGATIGLAYFNSKSTAARVSIGLDLSSTDTAGARNSTFGFSLDLAYRMYCAKMGAVAAFFQPSLFLARTAAAGFSMAPTGSIGAEYFFNNNLSFGIASGLNLSFSDSFKDIQVVTGTTAITGTFYW